MVLGMGATIVLDMIVCLWLNFRQMYSFSTIFEYLSLHRVYIGGEKHDQLSKSCGRTTFPKIATRYSESWYDRMMPRKDGDLRSFLIP